MDIGLKFNTRQLTKLYKDLGEAPEKHLRPALADGLDHASRKFFKEFYARRLQGPPGVKAHPYGLFDRFWRSPLGAGVKRDFRAKDRSSTVRAFMSGGKRTIDMGIEMHTSSRIAKHHEQGIPITSKSGGKIAVPMPPKIRPEMYDSLGRVRRRFQNPKAIGDLERVQTKGQTYLVKKYRRKSSKFMFVLKNRIPIKARLGYEKLFKELSPEFTKILDKSFEKGLRKFWEAA